MLFFPSGNRESRQYLLLAGMRLKHCVEDGDSEGAFVKVVVVVAGVLWKVVLLWSFFSAWQQSASHGWTLSGREKAPSVPKIRCCAEVAFLL